MTIRMLPSVNWHVVLVDAIKRSEDGDEIVCSTDEMKELGERALERMCPEKRVTFSLLPLDLTGRNDVTIEGESLHETVLKTPPPL